MMMKQIFFMIFIPKEKEDEKNIENGINEGNNKGCFSWMQIKMFFIIFKYSKFFLKSFFPFTVFD